MAIAFVGQQRPAQRHRAQRSCFLVCSAIVAFFATGGVDGVLRPRPNAGGNAAAVPSRDAIKAKAKALFAGPKTTRSKVLLRYRDYELVVRQERRKLVPKVFVRKTPLPPFGLASVKTTVEGGVDSVKGFPFTTTNGGSVQVEFPRISGHLGLALEDPPASFDADEGGRTLEVTYGQVVPALGDVSARAKTTGEWSASVDRDIEDIGHLRGTVDSQLDWSLELESSYKPVKGVTPTITYGATQDGMSARAELSAADAKRGLEGRYAVRNIAGKYAPEDFLHDCTVRLASGDGRQSIEAHGSYDRRLPKVPVRGSLGYAGSFGSAALTATVDFDRYRISCALPRAELSATTPRTWDGDGGRHRPAEVELRLGKASAAVRLVDGLPPHLRLSYTR